MLLIEYEQWNQDAITYWTDTITASGYSNIDALIIQATTSINNVETLFASYKNSSSLFNKTKDALIPLYTYINLHDTNAISGAPTINIVMNPYDWYTATIYELPAVEGLFTLAESVIPTEGELIDGSITTISFDGAASDDIDRIDAVIEQLPSSMKDHMLYRVFAENLTITQSEKTAKYWLLEDYHMEEIMAWFEWEVRGLNAP